ncbi:hypothetical protein AAHB66_08445 [Leclercia sp. S52]|uniref:hypothetical protein n=1 Tax=Leclercia sp. S52 TaxID=3138178 RepID=UPI00321BF967
MVSSRIKVAAALVLGVMLTPAYASNVLSITGSIVEDPCDISPLIARHFGDLPAE